MAAPEPLPLDDPRWLRALLPAALEGSTVLALPRRRAELDRDIHDALWSSGALLGAATESMPVATTTPAEVAFVQLVQLELRRTAALLRASYSGHQLRWALGSVAAAFVEELGVASVFDEAARTGGLDEADEERLFDVIGAQLTRRAYLLGNPLEGLPLHAGLAALSARTFLRLAAGQATHPKPLTRRSTAYLERLSLLKAFFVELVAGVFAQTEGAGWRKGATQQIKSLALISDDRRELTDRLRKPRATSKLLKLLPATTRPLVAEQVVLAALLGQRWSPEIREAFVGEAQKAGVEQAVIASAEARAAAFLLEYPKADLSHFERHTALDVAMHRTRLSLQEAADSLTQELKETGELGVLLTRMARGETVTPDERHKIREQLIDLAKVVPSLAIFAAPGGMLLLPLLIKILPFDLRPSAFQHRPASTPPPSRPT